MNSPKNASRGTKGFTRRPLEERFWEKVEKSDGCWLWKGAKADRGYGTIWANGRQRRATQVSWEIATGKPWPEGMDACHRCDNPPCVNPAHIFVGTAADNARDALAKGRLRLTPKGTKAWHSGATHCFRGHEFTPENTYVTPKLQYRQCRICRRAGEKKRVRDRSYRYRKPAALAALDSDGTGER